MNTSPDREPATGPLRVFDLFDPARPDPVLEAEVAAHHAAYADPRSYDAKKAWRDAHPDQASPGRRNGPGIFQLLREALEKDDRTCPARERRGE
jgi:hypothetical protein